MLTEIIITLSVSMPLMNTQIWSKAQTLLCGALLRAKASDFNMGCAG